MRQEVITSNAAGGYHLARAEYNPGTDGIVQLRLKVGRRTICETMSFGYHAEMKTKLLSILLILFTAASPAFAQQASVKSEKAVNIERLLKLVGADKLQSQMLDQAIAMLKPIFAANGQGDEANRKMANRFSAIMSEELRKTDLSRIAPELYDKYFTNDEIKGMIAFYESPLGQKTIQVLPALSSESMSRGQKIGEQAGQRAVQRFMQEFPEVAKSMQAR
jgi:hypothetical protein